MTVTADWLALPAPIHVDASPSGDRLAVTTATVPRGTDNEVLTVVVVDVAARTATPLAAALPGDHTATWSPDGTRIAFITSRDGAPRVAWCEVGGAEATVIAAAPVRAIGPVAWSPDGTELALAAPRGRQIDRTRPWRITRAVPWADGIGALDDPPQLWTGGDDGSGWAQLTDDEWRWSLPRWAPDGSRLAARAGFDPSGQRRGQHLRVVERDGTWTAPEVPGGMTVVPAWAADGRLVVLSIQPVGRPVGSEGQLHVVDGTTVVRLDGSAPCCVGGTVYGDSPAAIGEAFETALLVQGDRAIVRTQRGGRMGVASVGLDGDPWHELVTGDRCATPLAVAAGGLVIAEQSAGHPCRLVVTGADGETPWRTLPVGTPADVPAPAEVQRFTVASPHDRVPLDAWFLRPPGTVGALPAVLLVHGGPNAAFGECFNVDAQALVAAGYGVVVTNPHGSTGSGDAFTHAVFDHWGDIPTADVLAVVDAAVEHGWVDADRLGVTGNSYGGYLTAWLACTTDRFRAAVAENPVTDLLSMYGTSDIGVTFLPEHMSSTPLDDVGPYLRWSPLLRAAGCSTPLLFVVGADDRRCPGSQAFELHRVLRALGATSEVLVLPEASHEGSTSGPIPARLAHDAALVEWMDRWIGP